MLFSAGLALAALAGCGMRYVIELFQTSPWGQAIFTRVMIAYINCFVLFVVWTGMYAADYLLGVFQDTAAGIDEIKWPDDSIGTRLLRFLYLVWIAGIAVGPIGIVLMGVGQEIDFPGAGWLFLVPLVFVYPVILLCSMANDSMWLLLSGHVLLSLLRRPHLLLQLFLFTMLLLVPPSVLGYVTVAGMHYELTPVMGLIGSAALLAHARLLGRVGAELSTDNDAPTRRPRRRRKRKRYA
jgi:hypothetical protein